MEIRRLFGTNMKAALARVQAEVGDDALILETRQVNGGVEVTVSTVLPDAAPAVAVETPRQFNQTEPEIAEAEAAERLVAAGIDERRVAGWLADFDPQRPIHSLARHMPVAPRPVAPDSGRFALVGMPGSGKTTLIASLAANHALRYGADSVALVSLDTWRVGGIEQLETIARYLGVSVTVVRDPRDLPSMLDSFARRGLVLVDTPGIPLGQRRRSWLAPLADHVSTVLALPATASTTVLERLLEEHQGLIDGLALTQLDQVHTPGDVIEQALRAQKYFWWMSYGADIPDNIDAAEAAALARRLLALPASGQDHPAGRIGRAA